MNKIAESFKAFGKGLIDYAGLFPPASLMLRPALDHFAQFQKSAESWMLSRFIVPIPKLHEIDAQTMAAFSDKDAFKLRLSLITQNLAEDLLVFLGFREEWRHRIFVDIIETRFPASDDFREAFWSNAEVLQKAKLPLRTFYELPFDGSWDDRLDSAVEALQNFNQESPEQLEVGFKLRCGGVEAHQFPSPAQVARSILSCRDAGLPMKFTAGLHHPIRHFDSSVHTKMHGFVNVFGGGILAHVHSLDEKNLVEILADEDAAAFSFDDDNFSWRELHVKTEEIARIRKNALLSYGSCSFDEPRDDLRELRWLSA